MDQRFDYESNFVLTADSEWNKEVPMGGNLPLPHVITPSRISTPNLSNTPSQPSVQPSEEEEEEEVGLAKG